jgi:hypothetical protein
LVIQKANDSGCAIFFYKLCIILLELEPYHAAAPVWGPPLCATCKSFKK